MSPSFISEDRFMRIPVDDNYDAVLTPYFSDAFAFIDKAKSNNGCVLVHCMAGISRSATIAIGYFMKEHNCTHEEALRYVKDRRPSIAPNFNFLGQLLELEKTIKSERMLRFHESFGSTGARTTSESHITGRQTSKVVSDNSADDSVTASSRSLSVTTSGGVVVGGSNLGTTSDEPPHAPKRSKTDHSNRPRAKPTSAVISTKSRPTGLALAPGPTFTANVSSQTNAGKDSIDIESMVKTSLHVKTPEFHRENPLAGLTSTPSSSAAPPEFFLHSPMCEEAEVESGSQPATPTSSNKSSGQTESPTDADDSVFKIPVLPSPQSDAESSWLNKPRYVPTTSRAVSSHHLSARASSNVFTAPSLLTKHHLSKTKPSVLKNLKKLNSGATQESQLDTRVFFHSESKLFQDYCPKPLSPVQDCSPENAGGVTSFGLRLSHSKDDCATGPPLNSGVILESRSLNSSSSTTASNGNGASGIGPTNVISCSKPFSHPSKTFAKTKLMLSERLKFMVKHHHHQNIAPQVSMSEGNIVREEKGLGSNDRSKAPVRYPRARPSSFCLPAEYLDHWEEILAAARLSSRSMSCNMLEVRTVPFSGVQDFFATSSSSSYDSLSLSRPSSLEAVEVG